MLYTNRYIHPSEAGLQFVFDEEVSGQLDVFSLGSFFGFSLKLGPGFPLGLALEVQHAGLVGVVVSGGALLEEGVNLEKLIVGHFNVLVGGGFDLSCGLIEGHVGYVKYIIRFVTVLD